MSTQLSIDFGPEEKIQQALVRAKIIYDEENGRSGTSHHITSMPAFRLGTNEPVTIYHYSTRVYCTYDRPDWSGHFKVTWEEACAIVDAGLATGFWNDNDQARYKSLKL